jgi:hypothetical protein
MTSEKQLLQALQSAVSKLGEAQTVYLDAHHAYARYRLGMIANGKEPDLDVGLLPKAQPMNTPADQVRREQLARDNAETERAVRRDPVVGPRFG